METITPHPPTAAYPAEFKDGVLAIAIGSFETKISVKQIESTWDTLSHFPERRARHELSDLGERINRFATVVAGLVARGGRLDETAEVERFARRHVTLTRRAWAMDSRCMSWFVVGPARFPVERNDKRLRWADGAYLAVREHTAAARKAERGGVNHNFRLQCPIIGHNVVLSDGKGRPTSTRETTMKTSRDIPAKRYSVRGNWIRITTTDNSKSTCTTKRRLQESILRVIGSETFRNGGFEALKESTRQQLGEWAHMIAMFDEVQSQRKKQKADVE